MRYFYESKPGMSKHHNYATIRQGEEKKGVKSGVKVKKYLTFT